MYLKRINLYRQRVWTCKSTGKTSLTYEEALHSEKLASKKVQTLPRELVAPALRIIQFSKFFTPSLHYSDKLVSESCFVSLYIEITVCIRGWQHKLSVSLILFLLFCEGTLSLKDLADTIATELQTCFFAGAELYGNRDGDSHPCRILNILTDGDSEPQYEVGFLDKDKEINEKAVLSGEDLSWKKKFPFSRNFLKSFIRESTCHSTPWVVNEYLAKAHGITRNIPKELKGKYVFQNGELVQQRKQVDVKYTIM